MDSATVFAFLDALRASSPDWVLVMSDEIQAEFGFSKNDARRVLEQWLTA